MAVQLEHAVNLRRNQLQFTRQFRRTRCAQLALLLPEPHCNHGEHRNLGSEGLGRGNADFGAGVGVGSGVGFARNRRTDHITDSENRGTPGLCHLDGCKRVGGFARLRNRNNHVEGSDYGVAVAKLAGVLYLHRNSGQVLNEVLSHQACMPRGSAANYKNALRTQELVADGVETGHFDFARLEIQSSAHGVKNGLGLFKDFFDHEVIKSALLNGR